LQKQIDELNQKISSLEKEKEYINTHQKDLKQLTDNLNKLESEKKRLEDDMKTSLEENNNIINNLDMQNIKFLEITKENENLKIQNANIILESKQLIDKQDFLNKVLKESKILEEEINQLRKTLESNKELIKRLESNFKEKESEVQKLTKLINKANEKSTLAENQLKQKYESEKELLLSQLDKLNEENINLNLAIQEKNEIIISLENKINEVELICKEKIEINEEETNKKLLEMDLHMQDLNDRVNLNNDELNSKEKQNIMMLNSKYSDLKEKCLDFVTILQTELKDFEFYADKRIFINFLIKYFDKNSNEKLKYSLLDTLANILSLDNEIRKGLYLQPINPNILSSNSNIMTDIESIPFIISKFYEYLENVDL